MYSSADVSGVSGVHVTDTLFPAPLVAARSVGVPGGTAWAGMGMRVTTTAVITKMTKALSVNLRERDFIAIFPP